jgi:hypothetical protein
VKSKPTVTVNITNSRTTAIVYTAESYNGTPVGVDTPISAGQPGQFTVTSNIDNSAAGGFRYEDANGRACRFGYSRVRTSLSGPWGVPTRRADVYSGTGVTCTSSFGTINANGDFTVNFTIQ